MHNTGLRPTHCIGVNSSQGLAAVPHLPPAALAPEQQATAVPPARRLCPLPGAAESRPPAAVPHPSLPGLPAPQTKCFPPVGIPPPGLFAIPCPCLQETSKSESPCQSMCSLRCLFSIHDRMVLRCSGVYKGDHSCLWRWAVAQGTQYLLALSAIAWGFWMHGECGSSYCFYRLPINGTRRLFI